MRALQIMAGVLEWAAKSLERVDQAAKEALRDEGTPCRSAQPTSVLPVIVGG